jgi:hypothetical protein
MKIILFHHFSPFGLRFQLRPNKAGAPEVSICCVIKGLHIKASDSFKIQAITPENRQTKRLGS